MMEISRGHFNYTTASSIPATELPDTSDAKYSTSEYSAGDNNLSTAVVDKIAAVCLIKSQGALNQLQAPLIPV